eukprot:TRINITY_DN8574_c0_g1_i1.p1 TRINITY_DN8574_c0_g1~~TRINITY_DN8574_c0_g1_i1.p1  ORF type:complete len:1194 (+),score=208.01 TRINITY_DN8574_c0_g1_i1:130-3711(+)
MMQQVSPLGLWVGKEHHRVILTNRSADALSAKVTFAAGSNALLPAHGHRQSARLQLRAGETCALDVAAEDPRRSVRLLFSATCRRTAVATFSDAGAAVWQAAALRNGFGLRAAASPPSSSEGSASPPAAAPAQSPARSPPVQPPCGARPVTAPRSGGLAPADVSHAAVLPVETDAAAPRRVHPCGGRASDPRTGGRQPAAVHAAGVPPPALCAGPSPALRRSSLTADPAADGRPRTAPASSLAQRPRRDSLPQRAGAAGPALHGATAGGGIVGAVDSLQPHAALDAQQEADRSPVPHRRRSVSSAAEPWAAPIGAPSRPRRDSHPQRVDDWPVAALAPAPHPHPVQAGACHPPDGSPAPHAASDAQQAAGHSSVPNRRRSVSSAAEPWAAPPAVNAPSRPRRDSHPQRTGDWPVAALDPAPQYPVQAAANPSDGGPAPRSPAAPSASRTAEAFPDSRRGSAGRPDVGGSPAPSYGRCSSPSPARPRRPSASPGVRPQSASPPADVLTRAARAVSPPSAGALQPEEEVGEMVKRLGELMEGLKLAEPRVVFTCESGDVSYYAEWVHSETKSLLWFVNNDSATDGTIRLDFGMQDTDAVKISALAAAERAGNAVSSFIPAGYCARVACAHYHGQVSPAVPAATWRPLASPRVSASASLEREGEPSRQEVCPGSGVYVDRREEEDRVDFAVENTSQRVACVLLDFAGSFNAAVYRPSAVELPQRSYGVVAGWLLPGDRVNLAYLARVDCHKGWSWNVRCALHFAHEMDQPGGEEHEQFMGGGVRAVLTPCAVVAGADLGQDSPTLLRVTVSSAATTVTRVEMKLTQCADLRMWPCSAATVKAKDAPSVPAAPPVDGLQPLPWDVAEDSGPNSFSVACEPGASTGVCWVLCRGTAVPRIEWCSVSPLCSDNGFWPSASPPRQPRLTHATGISSDPFTQLKQGVLSSTRRRGENAQVGFTTELDSPESQGPRGRRSRRDRLHLEHTQRMSTLSQYLDSPKLRSSSPHGRKDSVGSAIRWELQQQQPQRQDTFVTAQSPLNASALQVAYPPNSNLAAAGGKPSSGVQGLDLRRVESQESAFGVAVGAGRRPSRNFRKVRPTPVHLLEEGAEESEAPSPHTLPPSPARSAVAGARAVRRPSALKDPGSSQRSQSPREPLQSPRLQAETPQSPRMLAEVAPLSLFTPAPAAEDEFQSTTVG